MRYVSGVKTPKTTNSTQSRVADSRVEAAQALKPAALIYQSLIRDDPLAYCLLVAKRMRFWQAVCLKRMDYAQEKICRNEAENWEAQARRLRAMGHAVKWQRARELKLPVDGKTVPPGWGGGSRPPGSANRGHGPAGCGDAVAAPAGRGALTSSL